jgi:5-methylcytosine-specific restriction endonuclease McrA
MIQSEKSIGDDHVSPTKYDKQDEYCLNCGESRALILIEDLLTCLYCGNIVKMITNDHYHEINHFKEVLAQLVAIEKTQIPQEVYDTILLEFEKEGNNDVTTLTRRKVLKYLRKYHHRGYSKYYENINQIIEHLNGTQTSLSPDTIQQIQNMFQRYDEPHETHLENKYQSLMNEMIGIMNYTS